MGANDYQAILAAARAREQALWGKQTASAHRPVERVPVATAQQMPSVPPPRYATISPAVSEDDDAAARAESLRASAVAHRPARKSAYREAEIETAKRAIADILAKLR